MTIIFFNILVSLVGLIWSADRFVAGASALADKLGVQPLIIGLTIVALGTSAPEIFVSLLAGLHNHGDIALGNAVGSNIANICLVLSVCAIIRPIPFCQATLKAELPILLFITLLTCMLLYWFRLSVFLGVACIAMITLYLWWLLKRSLQYSKENKQLEQDFAQELPLMSNKLIALWLTVGIILLPLCANILVDNGAILAKTLGVSDAVIGLSLIAIGTSLPELATSLLGIYRNEHNIALGNIIGSNIFNLTAVLAPVALIADDTITDPLIFTRDMPVMVGATLLLCGRIWFNGAKTVLSKWFGSTLFGAYCLYLWVLSQSLV